MGEIFKKEAQLLERAKRARVFVPHTSCFSHKVVVSGKVSTVDACISESMHGVNGGIYAALHSETWWVPHGSARTPHQGKVFSRFSNQ